MKKLLTVLFLAMGAVAFANNGVEPVVTEKSAPVTATAKKAELKNITLQDAKETKARPAATKGVCTTCSGDARFNISGYFAEFVNRNNMRLVKLLLTE